VIITRRPLVLASTSPFRRELLQRLRLPFDTMAPGVDETPLPDESAEALVLRLSAAKAHAVAGAHPGALIIGSDQAAVCDGAIIGKPGSHERAVAQLTAASGRRVSFFTGLCLLDSASGAVRTGLVPYHVYFRTLGTADIEDYLRAEQPYHCAGSFKSEGLGVTLFERMEGDDPTALVGLPLILLARWLREAG
jgi:MAF protein